MTDAHCHVSANDPTVREFLIGRDFVGVHPWETLVDAESSPRQEEEVSSLDLTRRGLRVYEAALRARLAANAALGVGEIGLDRLKERTISPEMRELFETQLQLALELNRPVVLHGAKCWGEVVKTVLRYKCKVISDGSRFLFHGFSRSDGLIPEIVKLGGFISVGPAILNDHAVNYRAMVKKIPLENLLVETDRTESSEPVQVRDVLQKLAEVRDLDPLELERLTDANATRFIGGDLV